MHDDPTCVRIPLRDRHGAVVAYAIVDSGDAQTVGVGWLLSARGYVVRSVPRRDDDGRRKRTERLHRVILGLTPGDGLEGDHKNGDKLDNRRSNLRVGTRAANGQNMPSLGGASGYRGVYPMANGRWIARAMLDGRHNHIGCFATELEADAAASAWRLANMPFTNEDRRLCDPSVTHPVVRQVPGTGE